MAREREKGEREKRGEERERREEKEAEKEKRTAIRKEEEKEERLKEWVPKTVLGRKVLNGEIKSLQEVFNAGLPVMEPEIVDYLTEIEEKIVDVQKTTRVVRSGRKFSFRVAVLVGNKNGFVGVGTAKGKEKWPAAKKAAEVAKLNLVQIKRGCGSWECTCGTTHSIPFTVSGQNASVKVTLMPAPKGVGLVVGKKIRDVMRFAGIQDVWSKTFGHTRTELNFVRAAIDALAKTNKLKISEDVEKKIEAEKKCLQ